MRRGIHLYLAFPHALNAPALCRAYLALMTPEERARHDRFVVPGPRLEFRVARALVRTTLSRHAPEVAPEAWRFDVGAVGKPFVSGPPGAPRLSFNLSHTRGLVVCAVARRGALGVDVENVTRRTGAVTIAERFFAKQEVAALRAEPEARQRDRFFDFWTLKESYIKARGLGLRIPLGDFGFILEPARRPALWVAPSQDDPATRWRFGQWSPTPWHRLALCWEVEALGPEPPLTWHHAAPLGKVQDVRVI